MLQIRPLDPLDSIFDLTTLLHRAYARLGAMGLNYTAVDQSPEVTQQRINNGHCYVALWSGTIVGTLVITPPNLTSCCAYYTQPGVAAVHQFAVEPSFQCRGVGRALLETCEQWAIEQGYCEVAMDIAEQAEHLIQWYVRWGYSPVGTVQWPNKVDRSIVFSKQLTK
jgi:GNAT superfamily N-acetyltransferase